MQPMFIKRGGENFQLTLFKSHLLHKELWSLPTMVFIREICLQLSFKNLKTVILYCVQQFITCILSEIRLLFMNNL